MRNVYTPNQKAFLRSSSSSMVCAGGKSEGGLLNGAMGLKGVDTFKPMGKHERKDRDIDMYA